MMIRNRSAHLSTIKELPRPVLRRFYDREIVEIWHMTKFSQSQIDAMVSPTQFKAIETAMAIEGLAFARHDRIENQPDMEVVHLFDDIYDVVVVHSEGKEKKYEGTYISGHELSILYNKYRVALLKGETMFNDNEIVDRSFPRYKDQEVQR